MCSVHFSFATVGHNEGRLCYILAITLPIINAVPVLTMDEWSLSNIHLYAGSFIAYDISQVNYLVR